VLAKGSPVLTEKSLSDAPKIACAMKLGNNICMSQTFLILLIADSVK
jgi:hypothetical protein